MRIKQVSSAIDWNGFRGRDIILPVCPRSQGMRGRNFTASLDALATQVDHVHVVMCDALDRHNLNGDMDLALRNADMWMAANLPEIDKRFTWDLRRWQDVQADESFAARHHVMKRLYAESLPVRAAIDRISSYYLESKAARAEKEKLPFNHVREQAAAAAYLVEEFAGTAVYKDWHPGLPEAYWGVYVGDVQMFNRHNHIDPSVDLALPETLAIHVSRLPAPIVGEKMRCAG